MFEVENELPTPMEQETSLLQADENNEVVPENLQKKTQESPNVNISRSNEDNFKKLREKVERMERERNEALRIAKEAQERVKLSPLGSDDIVEGKYLHEQNQRIAQLENEVKEAKLRAEYPDIYTVLSQDNIAKLREEDPEMAEAIAGVQDQYKQARLAYKMIKKMNNNQHDNLYQKEQEVAQRNTHKPKPINTIPHQQGDTPLTRANAFAEGLTDDLKKQLWKETQHYRNQS